MIIGAQQRERRIDDSRRMAPLNTGDAIVTAG
jgi:hypothetical protein